MTPGHRLGEVFRHCLPSTNPGPVGKIKSVGWLGNVLMPPTEELNEVSQERYSCSRNPDKHQNTSGWFGSNLVIKTCVGDNMSE